MLCPPALADEQLPTDSLWIALAGGSRAAPGARASRTARAGLQRAILSDGRQ
jgi:hypothetical protein